MMSTATNHLTFTRSASAVPAQATRAHRRRISVEAGLALEKLGHAIEYLTDEYMLQDAKEPFRRDGRLEAIELLMAVNREVYFSCPEVPSLRERLVNFLRHAA
jgi:hypothetical protein